jgi:hypothetical protein
MALAPMFLSWSHHELRQLPCRVRTIQCNLRHAIHDISDQRPLLLCFCGMIFRFISATSLRLIHFRDPLDRKLSISAFAYTRHLSFSDRDRAPSIVSDVPGSDITTLHCKHLLVVSFSHSCYCYVCTCTYRYVGYRTFCAKITEDSMCSEG